MDSADKIRDARRAVRLAQLDTARALESVKRVADAIRAADVANSQQKVRAA